MVSIYALIDPITQHVKYIGKAKNPRKRYDQHIYRAKKTDSNTYCYHWIRSLFAKNESPELLILDEVEESEWEFWEQHYISLYKSFGFKLTNLNNGGNDISEETKRKQIDTRNRRIKSGEITFDKIGKHIQAIFKATGEIQEFKSIAECAKILGLKASKISESILSGHKSRIVKGYIFKDLTISEQEVIYKIQFPNHVFLGIALKDRLDSTFKAHLVYSRSKNNTLAQFLVKNPSYSLEILEEVTQENKEERLLYLAERYVFDGFSLLNDRINNYRKTSEWKIIIQFQDNKLIGSYTSPSRIIEQVKVNPITLIDHITVGKYNQVGGYKFSTN